jgi:hypothetical protein
MKKTYLLAFAVLFCLFPFMLEAKDSGVRFSDLTGEVLVRPDENILAWDAADLEMILQVMDHIKTSYDSSAILSLSDMTTFVIKEESHIVLDTESEAEDKIQLLAGKIWVNVKKMVKDGSMNIEMSQAVAGIKGTNITCSSNEDGSENRVQVLRGFARVMINQSKEEIELKAGEELVIKAGAKPEKQEINIEEVEEEWQEEVAKMGASIPMDEIPEIIRKITEMEAQEIARLKEEFQRLMEAQDLDAAVVGELQKDAERFIGVVLEDQLVLASLKTKITEELAKTNLIESDRARLTSLNQHIAQVLPVIMGYSEEATKIMRYQFKLGAIFEDISSAVEIVLNDFNSLANEVENIQSEVANNPNGRSQDWFLDSLETLQEKMQDLDEQRQKVSELIERNPEDQSASNLLNQINSMQNAIAALTKDLAIVEISSSTIVEMQQMDDLLSDQMVVLQNEVTAYNSIDSTTADVAERRLQASLKIMDNYARVRRNYLTAQRLYDSTMRAVQGAKFKTAEQEEVENLWQNVSDRFQQLGIVADELQSNIESLESQLRQWLD